MDCLQHIKDADDKQDYMYPEAFHCMFTGGYIKKPIMTQDGKFYNRPSIEKWWEGEKHKGTFTSPLSPGKKLLPEKAGGFPVLYEAPFILKGIEQFQAQEKQEEELSKLTDEVAQQKVNLKDHRKSTKGKLKFIFELGLRCPAGTRLAAPPTSTPADEEGFLSVTSEPAPDVASGPSQSRLGGANGYRDNPPPLVEMSPSSSWSSSSELEERSECDGEAYDEEDLFSVTSEPAPDVASGPSQSRLGGANGYRAPALPPHWRTLTVLLQQRWHTALREALRRFRKLTVLLQQRWHTALREALWIVFTFAGWEPPETKNATHQTPNASSRERSRSQESIPAHRVIPGSCAGSLEDVLNNFATNQARLLQEHRELAKTIVEIVGSDEENQGLEWLQSLDMDGKNWIQGLDTENHPQTNQIEELKKEVKTIEEKQAQLILEMETAVQQHLQNLEMEILEMETAVQQQKYPSLFEKERSEIRSLLESHLQKFRTWPEKARGRFVDELKDNELNELIVLSSLYFQICEFDLDS